MSERATYVFGPRLDGGLIGNATPVEILAIAAGAFSVVGTMFVAQLSLSSVALITVIAGIVGWFVFTRSDYGDRRSHQIGVTFRFVVRRLRGQTSFQSGTGQTMPFLAGVLVHPTAQDGRQVGIIAADGLMIAVRRVHGVMWDLGGGDEPLAWGRTLDNLGDGASGLARMMVITRTVPAPTLTLREWWMDNATDSYPEFFEAYLDLLDQEVSRASDTELWLVTAVSARSLQLRDDLDSLDRKAALIRGAVDVAERASRNVSNGVPGSVMEPLLSVEGVLRFFESSWSPAVGAGWAWRDPAVAQAPDAGHQGGETIGIESVAPAATTEAWELWITEQAAHRVLWVEQYPRAATYGGFMWPLILKGNAARTVAQVYEPLSRNEALRAAVGAVIHERSDQIEKETKGQHVGAETRMAIAAGRALEEDISHGRVGWRLNTHIVVSAPDAASLDEWEKEVRDLAGESRVSVRPLEGQQAEAFTFGLPLCRGLE